MTQCISTDSQELGCFYLISFRFREGLLYEKLFYLLQEIRMEPCSPESKKVREERVQLFNQSIFQFFFVSERRDLIDHIENDLLLG